MNARESAFRGEDLGPAGVCSAFHAGLDRYDANAVSARMYEHTNTTFIEVPFGPALKLLVT